MKLLGLITTIFAANMLFAANTQAEEAKGFTIYPHVGQYIFDGNLDDDTLVGIGLGYRFDSPWAIELTYQQADDDFNAPLVGDTEIDLWHLSTLYNFKSKDNFQPFLSFGVGNADFDNDPMDSSDEFQFNAGVGVKWSLTKRVAIRGDLKVFDRITDDQIKAAATVGLHYAFGSKSEPAPQVVEDGDADNDGVMNSQDQCPGTAIGVEVDGKGCPKDDDGDGVYNYMDDCPGTTDRRAQIDAKGCYVNLESKVNVALNVEFDFDSSMPRDEHADEVQKVANFMHEYPRSNVVMEGHTDSIGAAEYNQDLSKRRASTIADMLVEKFDIDPGRVSSVGYGESQPVATNETEEGRQHNRRVVAAAEGKKEEIEMK